MHLWPTLKLRDSFKQAYLCKLEWNLERIKRSKQRTSSACDQPLLAASKSQSQSQEEGSGYSISKLLTDLLAFAGDLFFIVTCCCCCCRRAACDDREEN